MKLSISLFPHYQKTNQEIYTKKGWIRNTTAFGWANVMLRPMSLINPLFPNFNFFLQQEAASLWASARQESSETNRL
jgi:hypothetical protein